MNLPPGWLPPVAPRPKDRQAAVSAFSPCGSSPASADAGHSSVAVTNLIGQCGARRSGIPHRLALAEPDRHLCRADRCFLLPEICLRQQLDRTRRAASPSDCSPGSPIVVWSERFRRRGYRVFSYSLKAVGIGILVSLALRGFPGVQPDSERRGFRHDVRCDRRHRGDGVDTGRGNSGGVCLDRRLHHSTSALHRTEPRSGAVLLRCRFWMWERLHW